VLHKQVILLSVQTVEVPEVSDDERVEVSPLGQGFYRILARYGFMETPDATEIMQASADAGVRTKPAETSYYLGRERLIPTRRGKKGGAKSGAASGGSRMFLWRKRLFAVMSRNARSATEYFGIPPNRVVELGTQIEF
jgi:KUP system potassium uptake protein